MEADKELSKSVLPACDEETIPVENEEVEELVFEDEEGNKDE